MSEQAKPKQATDELPINQPVNQDETITDLNAVLDKNPIKGIGWWKANRP